MSCRYRVLRYQLTSAMRCGRLAFCSIHLYWISHQLYQQLKYLLHLVTSSAFIGTVEDLERSVKLQIDYLYIDSGMTQHDTATSRTFLKVTLQLCSCKIASLVNPFTWENEFTVNPVQAWILFRPYFHYCSSSAHYCEDHFHSRILF